MAGREWLEKLFYDQWWQSFQKKHCMWMGWDSNFQPLCWSQIKMTCYIRFAHHLSLFFSEVIKILFQTSIKHLTFYSGILHICQFNLLRKNRSALTLANCGVGNTEKSVLTWPPVLLAANNIVTWTWSWKQEDEIHIYNGAVKKLDSKLNNQHLIFT